MGKSTLLHRVALAIEDEPEYEKTWLPVRFPEEQYTVGTLAELWSNVLGAIGDALERAMEKDKESDDKASPYSQSDMGLSEIDRQLQILDTLPLDKRESRALSWINQWCDQHQKRLLL